MAYAAIMQHQCISRISIEKHMTVEKTKALMQRTFGVRSVCEAKIAALISKNYKKTHVLCMQQTRAWRTLGVRAAYVRRTCGFNKDAPLTIKMTSARRACSVRAAYVRRTHIVRAAYVQRTCAVRAACVRHTCGVRTCEYKTYGGCF